MGVEWADPEALWILVCRKRLQKVEIWCAFVRCDLFDAIVNEADRIIRALRSHRIGHREEHDAGGDARRSRFLEKLPQHPERDPRVRRVGIAQVAVEVMDV